jgi:hypothetical protein
MSGFVKEAIAKRVGGERPSPLRAIAVATVTGFSAAALTYKLMRSAD